MSRALIESMFKSAKDEDYIVIDFSRKSITIPKKHLKYAFFNIGHYLQITNKGKSETYLIKTDSIDVVTIVKPKFKGMTWYSQGETKSKAGV